MKKNRIFHFLDARGLLLIILLAFGIRMMYFVSLYPWNNEALYKTFVVFDARGYHDMALEFISTQTFNIAGTVRTPAYPIFLAACYFISGKAIWFALFGQILVNLLALYLVYKLALEFFSKKVALVTLLLLAIDYHQVLFCFRLVTETLFSLIFLASIYFLCTGLRRRKVIFYMAISGCCLGLATLTRPILFLFPAVVICFIIGYMIFNKKDIAVRSRIKSGSIYSFIYVVIYMLTISPWLLRNYIRYNEPKLTSLAEYNLLFYNVVITESERFGKSTRETADYFTQMAYEAGADTTLQNIHSFDNSRIYSQIAMKYIKNNFFVYCKSHLKGMVNLFYRFGKFSDINSQPGFTKFILVIPLIYFGIIYIFSLSGIVPSIRQNHMMTFLFIAIILYFDILTGVVSDSRYRIPVMPFIYTFCSVGIFYLYGIIKDQSGRIKNKNHLS